MELVYDRLERLLSAASEPERRSRALERALLALPSVPFPRGPDPAVRLALGTATPTALCWDPAGSAQVGRQGDEGPLSADAGSPPRPLSGRGVVVGFADGSIARWSVPSPARGSLDSTTFAPASTLSARVRVASSGVLSLRPSPDGSTVAVGSMDGRVALVRAESLEVACSSPAHRKYAVALAWLGDGHLVSGGWDGAVVAFEVGREAGDAHGAQAAAPQGRDPTLVAVARSDLGSAVTAVVALPPEEGAEEGAEEGDADDASESVARAGSRDLERGRWRALVAVRGSHLLQELRPPTAAEAGVERRCRGSGAVAAAGSGALSPDLPRLAQVGDVTLNASGDDHVSFSAVSLALSPPLPRRAAAGAAGGGAFASSSSAARTQAAEATLPSRLLAVATDSERALILDPSRGARDAPVLRSLHGVPTAPLASASAAWASDRHAAFGAPSGELVVFAIADGRKVATLKAHAPQVARACLGAEDGAGTGGEDPGKGAWAPTLVSVGFDKSAAAF